MHRHARHDKRATLALLVLGSACSSPATTSPNDGGNGSLATSSGGTSQADASGGSATNGGKSNLSVGGVSSTSGGASSGASTTSNASGGTAVVRTSSNTGGTSAAPGGAGGAATTGGVQPKATGGTSTRSSSGAIGGTSATGGTAAVGSTKSGGTGGSRAGVGGTQSTTSVAGSSTLTLNSLKIEANPKNVLSCFVSWQTAQPATSVVQFGVDGYEWEVADTNPVTDHRVLVIGMHASQTYQVKAISKNDDSTASAESTYKTGALPASIPVAKVTVNDTTKSQPGWTLMNIQKGDGTATARSKYPPQAVMYDADGQPVWYHIDGTTVDRGGAVSVDLTDVGVLIGPKLDDNAANKEPPREVDFAGNTVWECATPTCGGTGTLTHHAAKLPNGNYVVQRDITDSRGTAPTFEELTPDNKLVWSLDYRKFVTQPSGTSGDWCHGNSITINIEKDEVYANCRFMGLIKTTYKNPTLKWHLPASFNGKSVNGMKFSPTTSQYSDTHDPEIHDDGTILFFDNGGYSGVVGEEGNPHGYHSRAVEYKIDEAANTATLVWEFPGTFNVDAWYKNDWYLPFWGDADRLANGNVLVTAGVRGATAESRIFEVTKQDGKVVWEFRLPVDYGVYRSERITPPLVRAIAH